MNNVKQQKKVSQRRKILKNEVKRKASVQKITDETKMEANTSTNLPNEDPQRCSGTPDKIRWMIHSMCEDAFNSGTSHNISRLAVNNGEDDGNFKFDRDVAQRQNRPQSKSSVVYKVSNEMNSKPEGNIDQCIGRCVIDASERKQKSLDSPQRNSNRPSTLDSKSKWLKTQARQNVDHLKKNIEREISSCVRTKEDVQVIATISAAKMEIVDNIRSMQLYYRGLCEKENEYKSSLRKLQHKISAEAQDFIDGEMSKIAHDLQYDLNELELNT